jgi:hypothetical protein
MTTNSHDTGENKCRKRVIIRFECGGRAGCRYFRAMTDSYHQRKGYCEYYVARTGECTSSSAIAELLCTDKAKESEGA